jgi:hypothetical protein
MQAANPFAKEETLNIIESRPRKARIPANVRAVCIRPDPKDWKAKPRPDDIDAVMARLPPDTVELIDIHYNCHLPRVPAWNGRARSGTPILVGAGDGPRTEATALARPRIAANRRSPACMQVAGVFGDHRYTPGQDRFGSARHHAQFEVGVLGMGDARVAELAKALPRIMVTNGDVCFRATRPLRPKQYNQEIEAENFPYWERERPS